MSAEYPPEESVGIRTPGEPSGLIAGRVALPVVMAQLAAVRPVFHSEADLRHGFALQEHRPYILGTGRVGDAPSYVVPNRGPCCCGPRGPLRVDGSMLRERQ